MCSLRGKEVEFWSCLCGEKLSMFRRRNQSVEVVVDQSQSMEVEALQVRKDGYMDLRGQREKRNRR